MICHDIFMIDHEIPLYLVNQMIYQLPASSNWVAEVIKTYWWFVVDTFRQAVDHFHLAEPWLQGFLFRYVGVDPYNKVFLMFSFLDFFLPYLYFPAYSRFSKEIWRPAFAACALSWLICFEPVHRKYRKIIVKVRQSIVKLKFL